MIHERDEREKEKKRKRKRETLRKKNSSSFPLNSVSVDDDALIKRNVVSLKKMKRRKKEGKKKEFFPFSSFAGCLLHLSASVDSLRSFSSSSSISSSDSY